MTSDFRRLFVISSLLYNKVICLARRALGSTATVHVLRLVVHVRVCRMRSAAPLALPHITSSYHFNFFSR